MLRRVLLSLAMVSLLSVSASAADINLTDAKCPVAKTKAAVAGQFVEYKGAKVFLCCGNCKKAFAKDPEKFASRANAQLVATKQAKQLCCPLTGGKLNGATVITVAGAKVCFCCNNCKGKVEGAEGDAQVDLVFGKAAFKKAFKVAEK
ncbi:MAG: hypothetical protein JKY95_20195 [Planctomycetaceae bacterium]|nr:hypothetical protein [Planctomycetaceae bacterium]